VPKVFIALDALPLTRNGKLDRRALPAPQAPREVAPAATANGSPVEERIAVLAARVLGLAAVHPRDDFFSLGATSIEIVKLASLLEQEFGDRPAINQLVRLNSVAAIAAYYAGRELGPRGEVSTAAGEVLLDPKARDDFKHRQLGIRRFPGAQTPLPLCGADLNEEALRPYRERRSTRAFAMRDVSAAEFGTFLSCLRQISLAGAPKYRWASGGGLYPVQVYLHVQPDRVASVPAGTYYYHPVRHELFPLQPGARIERDIHFWNNQATAATAAFSIFLVANRRAIEPMYGEQATHFCLIEAGIIAHLLESNAAKHGIGLCQVANVDFEAIRHLFHLSETHLYLHALLAGPLPEPESPALAAAGEMWEEGEL
jgi:pyochelin synthetase